MADFISEINEIIDNTTNKNITQFAILKLAINPQDTELVEIYKKQIEIHNKNMFENPFPDSGFELYVPQKTVFTQPYVSKFIDFEVKAEMIYIDTLKSMKQNTAFQIYPRSSISKTPLMLGNHTGIIDSGYRGSLIGALRWLPNDTGDYIVDKHTRLLQICHPLLCRIFVKLVDESDLSITVRGVGGFGSTGL
jgi:dUTPase